MFVISVRSGIKRGFQKKLVSLKTGDTIAAIHSVSVSADAKFPSEKWDRGELTGEQMKQELFALHRKIAEEEKRG